MSTLVNRLFTLFNLNKGIVALDVSVIFVLRKLTLEGKVHFMSITS